MEIWQLLVGTLSGFVIAFFAEPIKSYFEHRKKKSRFWTSLYNEICFNFVTISSFRGAASVNDITWLKRVIATDCYEYILKEDPVTFYQLDWEESMAVSAIYNVYRSIKYRDDLKSDDIPRYAIMIQEMLVSVASYDTLAAKIVQRVLQADGDDITAAI